MMTETQRDDKKVLVLPFLAPTVITVACCQGGFKAERRDFRQQGELR